MAGGRWHQFNEGQQYPGDEVIATCETHIASGGVVALRGKGRWLEIIRACQHEFIVYRPFSTGWGRSPMNPNCWRGPHGEEIWDRHTVQGG